MDELLTLGRAIPMVIGKTSEIYGELLSKNNKENILATAHDRETHSYGSHPRQQLDLYEPSLSAGPGPRPLIIFLYGGGFINGEKVLSRIPGGLVYTNLAYYFVEKHGFETIIPDYRLNGNGGQFPSGGEDIAGVLEWVGKRYAGKQKKQIYLFGNSAGGVHTATWLLEGSFRSTREPLVTINGNVELAGIIIMGALMDFVGAPPPLASVLQDHYGKNYEEKSPLMLLKKVGSAKDLAEKWPRLLILNSELDPPDIIQSTTDFLSGLRTHDLAVDHFVIQGHNHISPPLALGTGIAREEEWGETLVAWCKECR
ncbi:uncharacterized protein A1O9_01407 [Exophiala aquamarina CBS 119918]|uniref:BD-FAE-like domain-containing protein n=1 Tax=Exophiala aquamarina CBS 119918 TaxID=1182545 RepID=A0A072PTK1_9EURO|nr:uncharacterized protein A1O9_01407 [Exophiala aquamarina CBS 119918]KEF63429.1 hypothetical protein A1O9_01407 [Exophiala aquamarina CBS 119918]